MKRILCFFVTLFIFASLPPSSHATTDTGPAILRDPYSTPEQTWSIFKTSILTGDFATAKKCCSKEKTNGVHKFEIMNAEKRKNLIESMEKLEKVKQLDDMATYRLLRNANGVDLSTFVHFKKINNEWKIEKF